MRINLRHALRRWQQAGLIDAAAAQAIEAHEQANHKPLLARAAYLLGGFAVLLGLVALVAANWDAIPPVVKLSIHFAANGLVAIALFIAAMRGASMARELLALISFGLVLTLIALIGQVYQLQSPLWSGLMLWMLLASPMIMAFARSRFVLAVWLAALTVTLIATGDPLFDFLEGFGLTGGQPAAWMVAIYGLIPFVFIGLGGAFYPLLDEAPFPPLLLGYGLALLLTAASAAQIGWYEGGSDIAGSAGTVVARLFACLWLALVAAAVLWFLKRRFSPDGFRAAAGLVGACLLIGAIPFVLVQLESRPAGAALFILLWAVAGWAGVTSGWVWAGRIAVGVIVLRLLVIYFELFGTLARTGVGLVLSGLVVIALTYAGVRVQQRMARRSAPQ